MKRKNYYSKSRNKKKNSKQNTIKHTSFQDIISKTEKDKKIFEYFALSGYNPIKKNTIPGSVKLKNKKQYEIVKNPSKPRLSFENLNDVNKYISEASSTLVFDDNFVNHILSLILPQIAKFSNLDNSIIQKIIIKFLLQFRTDFIYLPEELLNKSPFDINYHNIKLFSGFKQVKKLSLQYMPSNIHEAKLIWPLFSQKIIDYVTNFKNEKALYIYSPFDYLNDIHKIEIICNDLMYNIIRIDETELNKNYKLNKISEATKSQRLPCLPEDINRVLFILEAMVNNFNQKLSTICKPDNCPPTFKQLDQEVITSSASTDASFYFNSNVTLDSKTKNNVNNSEITRYFSLNTKENLLFKTIQNNIFQHCNKQKTLLLFVDTFSNENDKDNSAHKYLMNIISKISGSKCPIIVLSNNIKLLGNLSHSTYENNFILFVNSQKMISHEKENLISQISLIIFFHLMFPSLITKQYFFLEEILTDFDVKFQNFKKENNTLIFQRINIIAEYIACNYNFDYEIICYKLLNIFKKLYKLENGKEKHFEDYLSTLEGIKYKKKQYSKIENLEQLAECYDHYSTEDYFIKKKENLSDKIFKQIQKVTFKKNQIYQKNRPPNLENSKIHNHLFEKINMKYQINKKSIENVFNNKKTSFFKKESRNYLNLFFNKQISTKTIFDYILVLKQFDCRMNQKCKGYLSFLAQLHDIDNIFCKFNEDEYFFLRNVALKLTYYKIKKDLIKKDLC